MLLNQLLLGTGFILGTAIFHVGGLIQLSLQLTKFNQRLIDRPVFLRLTGILSLAVVGVIAIHTPEVWVWAGLYIYLQEFVELYDALYFSVVTITTLGYGDVVLSSEWRLLSSFEAMGGLILFGTSTAFFLEVMRRILADVTEQT